MHSISEYLTNTGNSMTMASIFTANPFGFLMKIGESDEVRSRQSTDSGSMDRKTISDLQVRMMIWEFEAYLNGDHMKEKTSTNSANDATDEGFTKPSYFQTFSSLVTSANSNTFFKAHPGKRLKLVQLCGELHHKNAKKVMTDFRECVLRANPPLKSEKMAELFEIILAETLNGQREAEAAWRADPRNMKKLSTEYIGNKISYALERVSALFSQHSSKIMPVVDFLFGTDDDVDDVTDAHDVQAEATFSTTDSERARGHERVIKVGARELERYRSGASHSHCTVLVNDETHFDAENEAAIGGTSTTSHPSQLRHQPANGNYILSDSGFAQQVNRNTNNCADTEFEMEILGEEFYLVQNDRSNLIHEEVVFKSKSGKIKRRVVEGSLCTEDVYVDVSL